MEKYWVTEDLGEFMILTDEKCAVAGDIYRTVKDGYATREEAEAIVDRLNAIY